MLFFPSLIHCSGISGLQPNSARLAAQITRYPHPDQDLSPFAVRCAGQLSHVQGMADRGVGSESLQRGLRLLQRQRHLPRSARVLQTNRFIRDALAAGFGINRKLAHLSGDGRETSMHTCSFVLRWKFGNESAGAPESLQSELHRRGAAAGIGPPRLSAFGSQWRSYAASPASFCSSENPYRRANNHKSVCHATQTIVCCGVPISRAIPVVPESRT